jgi:hypothetical protein
MDTVTRPATPAAPSAPPARTRRLRSLAVAVAGPVAIATAVVFAMRGFVFEANLTNQHPDILTFWLPRSCLLGRSLASGHVPLWNPYEMAGTPFAADPQSGWLYLPSMLTSWAFGCGGGLRAFTVLNPVLAGVGLWWFLRREGLGRIAATAGGLALAMSMATSLVAISLPFAGTLAWTPLALVGASGYLASRGWTRLGWLAVAAIAWGQVASAHLSHGLLMCTGALVAYLLARSIYDVRRRALAARAAAVLIVGLLAFVVLANLAILIPRFSYTDRSSLRAGYGAFTGTVAPGLSGEDRPIPDHGIWAAWPLALASTPGAYVGAAILLAVPLAIRDRARRYLAIAFAALGLVSYLLTISLLVGSEGFRSLVARIPFGDVYLHNPGRLRYLALIVAPVLGALGIQALLDLRPSFRSLVRWFAAGFVVFLAFPLAAGANGPRLVVFAVAAGGVLVAWWAVAGRRRWAALALVGVLAAELLASALWSNVYHGGTVYFGMEGNDHPALVPGPLRWPDVPLSGYLAPTPFTRIISSTGGRYLAWIQPAAVFNKGYLFSQAPTDWPALLLGRAMVFGLHDTLGYSPIQLPRYWAYIRETNRLPTYYNAAVIQEPSPADVRLLGVRYLIVSEGSPLLPRGISGRIVAHDHGYELFDLGIAEPRVSVVGSWRTVDDGRLALDAVSNDDFDPAAEAVVEGRPPIVPEGDAVSPTTATYRELEPEDVRVSVSSSTSSIVVIRNAWDRGWSATVDGAPAAVYRTDYFLQGVAVPPGEHEIRLTYTEPTIGAGLLASAIAWSSVVAGWFVAWIVRRRRRRGADAPEPMPA